MMYNAIRYKKYEYCLYLRFWLIYIRRLLLYKIMLPAFISCSVLQNMEDAMLNRFIIAVVFVSFLSGCASKQIIEPINVGFSREEFVLASFMPKSSIGAIYYTETDADNKTVMNNMQKYRWHNVFYGFSSAEKYQKEYIFNQTRDVVSASDDEVSVASPLVNLSTTGDTLFKCKISINKVTTFIPGANSKSILDQLAKMKKEHKEFHFAYVSVLYEGTSFLESSASVKSEGNALFGQNVVSLNGKKYSTNASSTKVEGNVVYKLTYLANSYDESTGQYTFYVAVPDDSSISISQIKDGKKEQLKIDPSSIKIDQGLMDGKQNLDYDRPVQMKIITN